MRDSNPTPKEVQLIYKDTYNFYLKWIAVKGEIDWKVLIADAHEIEQKYPFELCTKMLVELVAVIETAYMERMNKNE